MNEDMLDFKLLLVGFVFFIQFREQLAWNYYEMEWKRIAAQY